MVTTAMRMPLCVSCRPATGEAGPWRLLRCRTRRWTGPAGMRCELLVERETRCRRAKSARNYGLRREVYTLRPGALSTALAGRFGDVAVNCRGAMGRDDPGRD